MFIFSIYLHLQIVYMLVQKRFRSGVNINSWSRHRNIGSALCLLIWAYPSQLTFPIYLSLQIDFMLVKNRFRSGVNIHRTRSFPGADTGSDNDLVMITFRVCLKKARKPKQPRLRFDLENLRYPDVACTFQATIDGKFAPLVGLSDEDIDSDSMITIYNTPVTDLASEILGKEQRRKKPWDTKDVFDLCDERRDLKKKRYETERAKEYRKANRRTKLA